MCRTIVVSVLAGACLLLTTLASAQTSSIAGTVKDGTGAVLPGVTVEASSPALIEKVRTAVTDGSGQFKLIELRPGEYSVTFTLPGFNVVKRPGIVLTTGFTASLNVEMTVGDVSETLTVTGESPVVDVQNVVQQQVMTREVIDNMPTGKLFANLGVLIPGAAVSGLGFADDVGGSAGSQNQSLGIHGGRNADQVVQLEGMAVSMLEGNGAVTQLLFPDSNVQEINLGVGAHSAEMETGGVRINIIPKPGGNEVRGTMFGSFTNEHLQSKNLDDDLRSRGLLLGDRIKYTSDLNPSIGGPIVRDRLWYYGGYRSWRTFRYTTQSYDTNSSDWVFTPDLSRGPVVYEQPTWAVAGSMTWQASPKNKISFLADHDRRCECSQFISGTVSIDATPYTLYTTNLTQATWVAPLTNKLLLEGGFSATGSHQNQTPQSTAIGPPARDLGSGIEFRSRSSAAGSSNEAYPDKRAWVYVGRAVASYVTGAHAFKGGVVLSPGTQRVDRYAFGDYLVVLLNGVPRSVEFFALPNATVADLMKTTLFVQDQWTVKRLTLNGGLRFDRLSTSYPAIDLPKTTLLPARSFPGSDILDWKDISPRMGVALDLSGNGKTALKASLNRYVSLETVTFTREVSPADAAGGRLVRTWTDNNGNFIPDGDPLNVAVNGELGPSTNLTFGQPRFTLRQDPDWARGWHVRPYNWETSISIQHELRPRLSANVGYFRRQYGNFSVTDNMAIGPADHDPYCITAPRDARLPGGGGQQICDLYDLNPAKLGQLDVVRTSASKYGDQWENWQGFDVTLDARLRDVLLQGGVSAGKAISDNCDVVTKIDNPSKLYCHKEQPTLAQVKLLGSYALPAQIQVAATFQSMPGLPAALFNANFGSTANYVATNAQILPSLGRNLSAGPAGTVTVNLAEPGTVLVDRMNQLDLRFSRNFSVGRGRLKGMIDLYNVLNSNPVLTQNSNYGTTGATWLVPQTILQGRLLKFGAQLDF